MIQYEQPFVPRPEQALAYRPHYERYKKCYRLVRELFQ